MNSNTPAKKIILGRIGRVHGIQGWLKITSYTHPSGNILNYSQWYVKHHGQWLLLTIEHSKMQGKTPIVKFQDCNDRELARTYTNDLIAVTRVDLPALPAEEYYWADLIGLTVINQDHVILGTIDHLFHTGANDVIVVKGEHEHLLPYIESVVGSVDFDTGIMHVNWDPNF